MVVGVWWQDATLGEQLCHCTTADEVAVEQAVLGKRYESECR